MKQFSKDLGNVSLAPKGKWSREQEYERLALVYNAYNNLSYVAKINVPSGVDIENREYWQPMNATGYADNNFINLTTENNNGTITAYESLEEAIATILPINRRAGATLSFYNLNSDRLDRQAEFELWQFNSTDLANWENKDYWNNVYYNWNVFVGWYIGADALKNHVKIPTVGQYAYVGSNLNDAVLYQCRTNGTWTNTGTKVRNYISVVVSGNITIGDNGNWFSDGKDTGIPATPSVDEQLDNIGLQLQQHNTEIDKLQRQDVTLKSNIDSNFETINNKIDNIKTATDNKIDTADVNLQKQITGNDNDIATLNTKHESLSKTVQGIAVTGGASTANNVTYNNDSSGLNAENAQDAIDEVLDELSDVISNVTNFTNNGVLYLDGTIQTSQPGKFKHTGYLKIDSNYPIILKADTKNQYLNYICFYNADKKFISGLSNTEGKRTKNRIESGNIPEETRYIIVCDNINNSDSFVSYHPFQEQTVNRFVDIPKGNNIYCPLYTSYNINSLKDTVTYSMPVFIKRNREYNTLTISKRDFGYFLHIYFYDIDNVLIKTIKDKSEGTIDIPSSCEYIGFLDFGKELRDGGKSMVNWGSEVMEYEPYDSFFMQSVINKEYFDKYTKNPGVQFTFKNKGFVYIDGNINTTQNLEDFRNTGYIKIDKRYPIMYLGDSANQHTNVISYYDADKKYISGLSNIDTKQETLHIIQPEDIPENTRYVICTAKTEQVEKSDNSAFFLCTPFNNIDNSTKIVDIPVGKNIYNQNFNYLNTLTFSKTVKCPTIIKRDENYNQLTISKRVLNYFLFIVFLDIDFIEISRITDKREGDTIDIPTNCQYIQFIDFVGELQGGRYTMVNWGSEIMEYEPYKSILSSNILSSKENFHKNRIYNKELSSLTTGSLVIDNVPNVKYNQTISLTARLGEIGKITLSHGKVLYAIGIVEIDDTNIYTYSALSHDPTLLETIPHGLTFNSFIQCIIRQNADATATIIIRTLGGEFKKDNIPFLGCRDDVMLEAENSNLTDIKLSYTCSDFSKDIWSFGDSYFDAIPAKLKELGYNNSLFDAYSGRNSVQAMQSLKKMIGIIGIPKIIYWAMGMNDADTEESVNTNWKNSLEELEVICSKYNVKLVLSTIPNVPKINHTFKNEIVKSSGYKYVDINKAVGADISTNWYSGLISEDKVHPKTGTGDYVIAMAVINTIPELRNI